MKNPFDYLSQRFLRSADLRRVHRRFGLSMSNGPSFALVAFAFLVSVVAATLAYPPAPYHLIYGLVRDEMGNPLVVTNAEVILETLSGVQLRTPVVPSLEPGVNYKLPVPMDAGLTADAYKATALKPTLPFRMKVKIGSATYVPIEMSGTYVNVGKAAESTRIDLTLGEDADGDGLPDAWERTLMSGDTNLETITPEGDNDGDGLTNLQEYLAGTYAFDPKDGLKLDIFYENGRPLIEFVAIAGRTYTLHGSADLQHWAPVPFRVTSDGTDVPSRLNYQANDVRKLRLEVLPGDAGIPDRLFLRAQVQ